jgi:hypothetical protein
LGQEKMPPKTSLCDARALLSPHIPLLEAIAAVCGDDRLRFSFFCASHFLLVHYPFEDVLADGQIAFLVGDKRALASNAIHKQS